jgi:hypothetical protein
VVEQLAVRPAAARLHPVAAHELVDVFEASVLAGVHDGAAVLRQRHPGAFVRGAADRRALDRHAGRVERVDLHHPAEAVRLVGMLHRVEALVVLGPAVGARLAKAPALLVRVELVAAVEVEGEVLLAGEVGAPRRLAARAVVQGAEDGAARRIRRCPHQRMARGGPAHGHRRERREAARKSARPHDLPAAVLQFDLDDRHAVGGLRLPHLLGTPRLHAVGVQQAVVGVLMVHREQAMGGAALERIEVDAVVVHAHLHFLLGRRVGGVGAPGGHVARHADRLAPGRDHARHIALGHDERVGAGGGHALEAEPGARTRHPGATGGQRAEERAEGRAQRELQHAAPRRIGHAVDVGIGGAIAVLHRIEVFRHLRFLEVGFAGACSLMNAEVCRRSVGLRVLSRCAF